MEFPLLWGFQFWFYNAQETSVIIKRFFGRVSKSNSFHLLKIQTHRKRSSNTERGGQRADVRWESENHPPEGMHLGVWAIGISDCLGPTPATRLSPWQARQFLRLRDTLAREMEGAQNRQASHHVRRSWEQLVWPQLQRQEQGPRAQPVALSAVFCYTLSLFSLPQASNPVKNPACEWQPFIRNGSPDKPSTWYCSFRLILSWIYIPWPWRGRVNHSDFFPGCGCRILHKMRAESCMM